MDETRPHTVEPHITWPEAVAAWRLLLEAAEAHRKEPEAGKTQPHDEKESQ